MPDTSSPDMSGIDPSLLQEFIAESQEILDGLDPLFVALEANPDDMSIVDGIFRPVHSVKGNSGFFGLTNIKNFAHVMENILGEIRGQKRKATPPLIDLLLDGVDLLRGMMNRLAQGDLSGAFTREEEAHLESLNVVSADTGEAPVSVPSGALRSAAKTMLESLEAVRRGDGSADTLARLEEASAVLIRSVIPGFFDGIAMPGAPVSVGYMLAGEEVTGSVGAIENFIRKLAENEKEEALCEAFLASLAAIREVGSRHEVKRGVVDLVDQITDDFVTIHESGIGFDDLMTGLIRERFDEVLAHIDRVEIGGENAFHINGENVTDLVVQMQRFVNNIQRLETDREASENFVACLNLLKDMADDHAPLVNAVEQIQDDFITIHESGIGFDDLMQSLLADRLTTVLAHLYRGAAVRMEYMLGDRDVTAFVRPLLPVSDSPARLCADSVRDAFIQGLQHLGEAAEKADRHDLALEAAGLVIDIQNIFNLDVGIDAAMETMIAKRLEEILDGIGKTVSETVAAAEGETAGDAAPGETAVAAGDGAAAGALAGGGREVSGKTLRVAEEKVDHFMGFVGELIITGEVFAYIQKKLEQYPEVSKVAQEFKNANLSFGELSSNLQKSLMEVRRVPLKSVLQKLHRIVRDTSASLGKTIDLEIDGEEVQIDKSLLEGLESPLVHMVRNSVDHGVESADERRAAGKPENGRIWIHAAATEEKFSLSIRDDGRGLDVNAIKEKAIARGILARDIARAMPDREAYRLVFNAGLSTARVVTDVSGRGVGMDVVLSNITKMNGTITVDSTPGQGSTFTIFLPMTVTLTVIDGLVARVGGQFYIIPLSDVRESVKPVPEQIHAIQGRREVLNVRGELHPVVRLNRILGIRPERPDEALTDFTAVLVRGTRGNSAAFLVDELIGQQSVVVKDLGSQFESIRCLAGGSILGDGRVGLVLSVQGILEDIGLSQPES